jgi:hypothetical protein
VPLSPEKAGDVLAAVESFLDPSVAGESELLRPGFFSVAKCTHLFYERDVSTSSTARSIEIIILCVSDRSHMLWPADDA